MPIGGNDLDFVVGISDLLTECDVPSRPLGEPPPQPDQNDVP